MVHPEKAQSAVLNSKGQITIPKNIREKLGLKPKTLFMVYTYEDSVVLEKFEELDLKKGINAMYKRVKTRIAKHSGLTQNEVEAGIQKHRNKT
jgi:AbrB family looped-hinge helix DNA binding protein